MAKITLQGNPINTIGDLPEVGENLTEMKFKLTATNLADIDLSEYKGKKIVLNIFPSLDTAVCAASVRRFNAELNELENTVVLCISRDLPFAHGRFCTAEGLGNVISLSEMRDQEFGKVMGVRMVDGPLAGLLARSVVVLDEELNVIYKELVPEIAQEPDYEAAIAVVK